MEGSLSADLSASLLPAGPRSKGSFARSAALIVGLILSFTAAVSLVIALVIPKLAVTGLLAYCFGCRHGVDADHIAAIDNVTRRLVASGRRPMTVGVFFSLGHCTIVLFLCVAVVAGVGATSSELRHLAKAGASVGPWVSAGVLVIIGSINLWLSHDFVRQWRAREAIGHEHEIASCVTRCCPALLSAVDAPWKVFWIGLLFGLGLDTATEIALLTLTALAQSGVPRAYALLLPLLFAAGMALVDSLNGLLMLWAYEWAAENGPMHRLFFSLFLTVASAVLALAIGLVEGLGTLAAQSADLRANPLMGSMYWLNEHLELVGVVVVVAFLVSIGAAVLLAPRCVPSGASVKAEQNAKRSDALLKYVKGGDYIVRFE